MKNEKFLKEVFIALISESSYPAITMNDLTIFCQNCNFIEGSITSTVIDRQFIAAGFIPPENPKFHIIGNALVRYEFWEFLVRVADVKYKQSGIVPTFSLALEKLLNEKLLPHANPKPWQSFRD